jgi:hypothetical protein
LLEVPQDPVVQGPHTPDSLDAELVCTLWDREDSKTREPLVATRLRPKPRPEPIDTVTMSTEPIDTVTMRPELIDMVTMSRSTACIAGMASNKSDPEVSLLLYHIVNPALAETD